LQQPKADLVPHAECYAGRQKDREML